MGKKIKTMEFYGKNNFERSLQIYYLLSEGKSISYLSLIKLLYFAERYHLQMYGGLIIEDRYMAMKLGPVQSQTKDILTLNRFLLSNIDTKKSKFICDSINFIDEFDIEITNPEQMNLLSESDTESINFSLEHFSKFKYKKYDLAQLTHDYPEWYRFEEEFKHDKSSSFDMVMDDFFKPSQSKIHLNKFLNGNDPFSELDSEIVEERRKEYKWKRELLSQE